MKNQDIDVVITWVDGNDPEWQKSKNIAYRKYYGVDPPADNNVRFRDWDNLQYLFRGIEKYMPWVKMVHFVTVGHLPHWLNADAERLNIVKHEDFIPTEYLPTFNSSVIELNLHRIPGLSEHFINFNDDMFVINGTKPKDFFKNGLPRDMACISPPPVFRNTICSIENNNLQIINDHFSKNTILEKPFKWFHLSYGPYLMRTFLFMQYQWIMGLFVQHIPYSYNKSIIVDVWNKECDTLSKACHNTFRSSSDYSEWLFREWQLMSNAFYPRRYDFGMLLSASNVDAVKTALHSSKYKVVCINDDSTVTDFDYCRDLINRELNILFPEKSSFEK